MQKFLNIFNMTTFRLYTVLFHQNYIKLNYTSLNKNAYRYAKLKVINLEQEIGLSKYSIILQQLFYNLLYNQMREII